jgi:hypothetical protein
MAKKRTLNEYRQSKEYTKNPWALYGPPKIGSEGEVEVDHYEEETGVEPTLHDELVALRKKYPNDQQFGYHVAKELL